MMSPGASPRSGYRRGAIQSGDDHGGTDVFSVVEAPRSHCA
jgi:hypothetical protein